MLNIPYKFIAILLLLLSCFGSGYLTGIHQEEKKFNEYKQQATLAATKQEAHTNEIIAAQQKASLGASEDYSNKLIAIRNAYRMQHSATNNCQVPSVPNSSQGTNEGASNQVPITELCAETTQQLISFQDWVKEQEKISDN